MGIMEWMPWRIVQRLVKVERRTEAVHFLDKRVNELESRVRALADKRDGRVSAVSARLASMEQENCAIMNAVTKLQKGSDDIEKTRAWVKRLDGRIAAYRADSITRDDKKVLLAKHDDALLKLAALNQRVGRLHEKVNALSPDMTEKALAAVDEAVGECRKLQADVQGAVASTSRREAWIREKLPTLNDSVDEATRLLRVAEKRLLERFQ